MNSLCGLKANGPFSAKSWPGTLWKLKFAILSLQITILKLKFCHFEAKIESFEAKTDHFEPKIAHFVHFEAKMVHFEGLPSFRFPSYALAPQNPPGVRVKGTNFREVDNGWRKYGCALQVYLMRWKASGFPLSLTCQGRRLNPPAAYRFRCLCCLPLDPVGVSGAAWSRQPDARSLPDGYSGRSLKFRV